MSSLNSSDKFISRIFCGDCLPPSPLRVLCTVIHEEVIRKANGSGLSAVGGFIVLRVLAPALTNPSLFDPKTAISKEEKKGILKCVSLFQMADSLQFCFLSQNSFNAFPMGHFQGFESFEMKYFCLFRCFSDLKNCRTHMSF